MSAVAPRISEGSDSSLFPNDDFLNFMETSNFLERAVDDIKEFIERRSDKFLQMKEKQQQILDFQTMKLKNEEIECRNKSEDLLKEIGELKSKLMQIEHSYFEAKNKLTSEKEANKILKDRANHLRMVSKQKNEKFHKTAEIYKTIIKWYRDYLNLVIEFDQENLNVITVIFEKCKKEFDPSIRIQLLDKDKYKILATHPSAGKINNKKEILQRHEIVLFIQKFWTLLKESQEK